mmetsp:Transcript_5168/g.19353  ORF Transcript_5168/g.19353 Transcript_5168/m.19353 type:complete len:216 (+) Transcript_5168:304-951(+)
MASNMERPRSRFPSRVSIKPTCTNTLTTLRLGNVCDARSIAFFINSGALREDPEAAVASPDPLIIKLRMYAIHTFADWLYLRVALLKMSVCDTTSPLRSCVPASARCSFLGFATRQARWNSLPTASFGVGLPCAFSRFKYATHRFIFSSWSDEGTAFNARSATSRASSNAPKETRRATYEIHRKLDRGFPISAFSNSLAFSGAASARCRSSSSFA